MTYRIMLLVELTKLSDMSDNMVVMSEYSLVSFGKLFSNGTRLDPTFISPCPASTLVIYESCSLDIFSSFASSILSVAAWLSMTMNSEFDSIVLAVYDWSRSATFCVMPVQYAPYLRTLFQSLYRN